AYGPTPPVITYLDPSIPPGFYYPSTHATPYYTSQTSLPAKQPSPPLANATVQQTIKGLPGPVPNSAISQGHTGQATQLPNAFTAGTLHHPTTGMWHMDTRFPDATGAFPMDSTGDPYPVTSPFLVPQAFLVSSHTCHHRLGHPGSDVLRRLV
ncbi:hypothetical protein Tco_0106526, partial [Tanacetum coccineum]